jgi:hypothetical protein
LTRHVHPNPTWAEFIDYQRRGLGRVIPVGYGCLRASLAGFPLRVPVCLARNTLPRLPQFSQIRTRGGCCTYPCQFVTDFRKGTGLDRISSITERRRCYDRCSCASCECSIWHSQMGKGRPVDKKIACAARDGENRRTNKTEQDARPIPTHL